VALSVTNVTNHMTVVFILHLHVTSDCQG
jgi:hypothetical protein